VGWWEGEREMAYTPIGIGDKLLLYVLTCCVIARLSPSLCWASLLILSVTLLAIW
jgi:hypothetical protein